MARQRRRAELEAMPLWEQLEALVHWYHHVQNEHKRVAPEGTIRRRIEDQLLDVRERFERLLDEWVQHEDVRREWLAHLHNRAPAPAEPKTVRPLVFRGRSDAGSIVEIRGRRDELDVEIDGTLVERIAAEVDFAVGRPPVHFHVNGSVFGEIFDAPDDALDALASFRESGGAPPWAHVTELLADGLIDVHFDLTPRGRRALAARET